MEGYPDGTFAPDKASAVRMFEKAEKYGRSDFMRLEAKS